jgi:hypothetical protein
VRGLVDGVPTQPSPTPFKGFFEELYAIIPPFTLLSALSRGPRALAINLAAAALLAIGALAMIAVTGAVLQWWCIAFGYYAVFSWASSLKGRDGPTFHLIWGSKAFLATILGYGTVAFMSYASSAFAPVYALEVLGEDAGTVGFWVGGFGALAGFLGVILGGRMSDWLRLRNAAGRILVVIFGLLAPIVPIILAFTTKSEPGNGDFIRFTAFASLAGLLASSALGAAAATTQDLVLPRMRGTATATFFLATTLVGLALGPYMAGQVSAMSGDLATGVLSTLLIVPFGLAALITAYRLVPKAADSVVERARDAGEAGLTLR